MEEVYYKVSEEDLLALAQGAEHYAITMLVGGLENRNPNVSEEVHRQMWKEYYANLTEEDLLAGFERID